MLGRDWQAKLVPSTSVLAMDTTNSRPINILSIDGGSNGLPALCILEEMFSRLNYDLKSEEELRPCDYFDVIGGTGTGALVALLLGKLKMTTERAIEAYIRLLPTLLPQSTKDEAQREKNSAMFEDTFRELLRDGDFGVDVPLPDESSPKTLMFTLNTVSMSTPYILRTYRTRSSKPPSLMVLQAACASIASQDKFSPVTVGEGHKEVTLVDATTGYANPTSELLREAKEAFGGEVKVATVLSLGTTNKTIRINLGEVSESSEKAVPQRVLENCEQVHNEMHRRLRESAIYYRFAPEVDPELPSSKVSGVVSSYLQQDATSSTLDMVIRTVYGRVNGPTLDAIDSVAPIEIALKPRPSLVRDFIGREDILHAMRQTHFGSSSKGIAVPAISVLTGLGGSGKTQIALKFTLEYEDRCPDAPVYFIDGSSETTLKTDLETIIHSQGSNHRSAPYEDALIWLATKSKMWLLIIDNVDDSSLKLSSFIPRCSHGHIIITTRDATRKILAPESNHSIEGLSTADAVILLLKSSGYESNPSNQIHAKAIVKELGHLPLALAHAAAYISIHQCLSTFLSTYRQSRAQLLESKPDLVQGYPYSVAATIQMSLDQLSPTTKHLLRIFAHLDARSIAYVVLSKAAERSFRYVEWTDEDELQLATIQQANILMDIFCPSQQWVPAAFDEIISTCLRYSLLRVATQNEERFYSMHVLVQSYLQENAGTVQGHTVAVLVARLLGSAVLTSGHPYDHLAFYRRLLPHVRTIDVESIIEPGDHYGLGIVLREMDHGLTAIAHLERGMEQWKRSMGEDDENILGTMTMLGHCYNDVGKDEKALEIREKALEISKRISDDDDPDALVYMQNLANSYSDMGREQEALELREAVVEKRRVLLGDDHRDTLDATNNLANSYSAMGREQEALELREAALGQHKRLLGDDHRHTLEAMHNLAISYSSMGRELDALPIRQLALEKFMTSLGNEHADTLRVMYNLAQSYRNLKMVAELEELLRTALPLHERILGSDHKYTKWLHEDDMWVRSRIERQSNRKRKRITQGSRKNNKKRK